MALRNLRLFLPFSVCKRPSIVSRNSQLFLHSSRSVSVNSRWSPHHTNMNLKLNTPLVSTIDVKITLCTNVDDLLSTIGDNKLSMLQMAKVIYKLGKWKEEHADGMGDILKDDRFSQLCLNIETDINSIGSNNLINILKNLLMIGLSSESYVIKSVEHELLWRIRKMSLRQISLCLSFHKDFMDTYQQREVVLELVDSIQKRWFDIHDSMDLIRILRLSNMLRDESVSKILDRALDLVGNMPVDLLIQLFCLMAELKQRPTPLLRAIAYHIKQSEERIPIKKLVNITYAMHVLNFRDSDFLDRVSEELLPDISRMNKSTVVSAFLTAFGNLQYCNSAVLEQFSGWIKNNISKCRHQDFCTLLLTLGRLNYVPVEDPLTLDIVIEKLDKDLTPPTIWLGVVWSLVAIQKADHKHIASVLEPSFYRPLIDKDDHSNTVNKLKLLNINGAAKFDVEGYSGPFLMYEPALEDIQYKLSGDKLLLHKSTVDSLAQIVPVDKGLSTDVMTKMGFHIDAEFIVDDAIVPRPSKENINTIEMKGPQPLAPNLHRVAVLIWTYRDLTLNTSVPIGVNALATRILKKLGYNVVEIFFNEVNERMTVDRRVTFTKEKIQQAIGSSEN